jgi:hypothetical protein
MVNRRPVATPIQGTTGLVNLIFKASGGTIQAQVTSLTYGPCD